ncbi:hypothetical protein B296_00003677 [Ensete ventricosum]|uniref:Uncharacterized protein n=1 Tax=Ensete ventricosum TaxID=4639 RepID=A0A426ZU52_ENSVE|nr:hypothetical protein B296_00003677 [Ensete ventricosum]
MLRDIIIFLKKLPEPSFTLTASPLPLLPLTHVVAALARRQPLCQGAATPTVDTSMGTAPAGAVAAGRRPYRRCLCPRAVVQPTAPARGLAMAMPGCPLQGLPSLQKRSKNA